MTNTTTNVERSYAAPVAAGQSLAWLKANVLQTWPANDFWDGYAVTSVNGATIGPSKLDSLPAQATVSWAVANGLAYDTLPNGEVAYPFSSGGVVAQVGGESDSSPVPLT